MICICNSSFYDLGKKKKGKRVTFTTIHRKSQAEVAEPVTPVHLSKTLCEVEVPDNKVIRFNVEDHLPIIAKDVYLQQKNKIATPNKVSYFVQYKL